jgi:hypothetical protein
LEDNPLERNNYEDMVIDGKIIFKSILRKNRNGGCVLESSASVQGPMAGFCEHSNELSVSIKLCGISLVSKQILAFEEGLSSLELASYA